MAGVEPRDALGGNMRRHRHRREMTQEELAHACGVHLSEISRLERGIRDPRLGTIVRVARALEVRPAELLEGIV